MQESAVKINHIFGQRVANDRNPSSGSGSRGKPPSLFHSNKNHYTTSPYPSPASHTKQVQKSKPNLGLFLGP